MRKTYYYFTKELIHKLCNMAALTQPHILSKINEISQEIKDINEKIARSENIVATLSANNSEELSAINLIQQGIETLEDDITSSSKKSSSIEKEIDKGIVSLRETSASVSEIDCEKLHEIVNNMGQDLNESKQKMDAMKNRTANVQDRINVMKSTLKLKKTELEKRQSQLGLILKNVDYLKLWVTQKLKCIEDLKLQIA